MADSIARQSGLRAELVRGYVGAFDVELDGEMLFSKRESGRFPEPGEVEAKVARRLGATS